MNDDRMTPEALAEIEGKAKKCADNKLPAFALVYSTERELALEAVPQMAAEIRRAWTELEAANCAISEFAECIELAEPYKTGKEIIEKYRFAVAETGGNHE